MAMICPVIFLVRMKEQLTGQLEIPIPLEHPTIVTCVVRYLPCNNVLVLLFHLYPFLIISADMLSATI